MPEILRKRKKQNLTTPFGRPPPNTKKVALRMARCPRKIYWNWQIKSTNSIMKEVKIEYNKILLPFCCGLTAFSNLLQPFKRANSALAVAAWPHFLICYNNLWKHAVRIAVAAWPHFLICYNRFRYDYRQGCVAAWPHFLICYNLRQHRNQPHLVAAWPHFLICYNY